MKYNIIFEALVVILILIAAFMLAPLDTVLYSIAGLIGFSAVVFWIMIKQGDD